MIKIVTNQNKFNLTIVRKSVIQIVIKVPLVGATMRRKCIIHSRRVRIHSAKWIICACAARLTKISPRYLKSFRINTWIIANLIRTTWAYRAPILLLHFRVWHEKIQETSNKSTVTLCCECPSTTSSLMVT